MTATTTNWSKLSRAWVNDFIDSSSAAAAAVGSSSSEKRPSQSSLQHALERTLPLLADDPITSVPFICRYRTDIIHPLSTKQVHKLSDYIQKYHSLTSLRNKVLDCLLQTSSSSSSSDNAATILRVETSISKSELDDIYSPFKPPSKGTLEDRIKNEHPELITHIDGLWSSSSNNNDEDSYDYDSLKSMLKLHNEKAIILLANRIAGDANVIDAIMDNSRRYCRIHVKQQAMKTKAGGSKVANAKASSSLKKSSSTSSSSSTTSNTYHDYNNRITNMQDYQVLAVRRGIDQKILKHTFELNDDYAKRAVQQVLHVKNRMQHQHDFIKKLYRDAIDDAWSRLLRKRCTTRLWKEKCQQAELRAIEVFCDNLSKALLAPPAPEMMMGTNKKALLALDPGFKAGIKCAILTNEGKTLSLDTVKFVGGASERDEGKRQLASLLKRVQQVSNDGTSRSSATSSDSDTISVVLGNGHGAREARQLLQEATTTHSNNKLNVDIHLVSEAGASVWSVTDAANEEFPKETPASIAAVSIGRRYLNPLAELVKVPPKSLGLGMYQHDLSEKILDEKLTLTSIDCVAEVGVDVNSCSLEILEKVPSLTKSLASKVFNARPLKSRRELLKVKGLGDKTYENAAAFIRVSGGKEPLDNTLVHPESYDLARWLLKELQWKLNEATSVEKSGSADSKQKQEGKWNAVAKKASSKFTVSEDRALSVIEQLFFSITCPDPRTRNNSSFESAPSSSSDVGSTAGCTSISSDVATISRLRDRLPHRNIIGTIRNVVDFGAFVDFGLENDGLLHRSKLGPVSLGSLLVGQEVGVDILAISNDNKVSLGLAGLNFPVEDTGATKRSMPSERSKKAAGPVSKKRRK